jgi:release factor glutamine methyltransferase
MIIKELLRKTEKFFKKYKIPQPRLDAEVLLADLLDMERIKLYVNFDYPLKKDELIEYRKRVTKRAKREPIAYIIGHKEFMSLDFTVEEGVLVPRPETELLVEEIIGYCEEQSLKQPNIVEVGTGTGVIMVSLAHYIEEARILGIDTSSKAVELTKKNIKKHDLQKRLRVLEGDLLEPLLKMDKKNVDIVVSNPPYISKDEMKKLPPEVKKEPELALAGGEEGLEIYHKLIPQAKKVLRPGGLLSLEIGYDQGEKIRASLKENGWKDPKIIQDYSNNDRIVFSHKVES